MAQQRKRAQIIIIIAVFFVYFIIAARPVPRETVLVHRWLSSLELAEETTQAVAAGTSESRSLLPFTLGSRFGYLDSTGGIPVNRIKTNNIGYSKKLWTEYENQPSKLEIKNTALETVISIDDPRGYPVFLDNRVFIIGTEQNALSEINTSGEVLWTYEFGAPLTCIDAAAGLVLTGSVDGIAAILDAQGKQIFYFEPGGSRYAIIQGCALSGDGSRIGIVSGVDQQRFLLLERVGISGGQAGSGNTGGGSTMALNSAGDYRVVFHEFIGPGFRRPVLVSFIDQDRRVVFEQAGGLGSYNIKSRKLMTIPLESKIIAIDPLGDHGLFFLITSNQANKELVGIKFPNDGWLSVSGRRRDMRDAIFLRAPFKSNNIFLGRHDSMLIAGGGSTLISFELEEK